MTTLSKEFLQLKITLKKQKTTEILKPSSPTAKVKLI
jgi:hypothetical protein